MEELLIEKKYYLPFIHFNPKTGILKMHGKSILEDPDAFFNQIFYWLHEYFSTSPPETIIEINLEYINSSSSKYLHKMLQLINNECNAKNKCNVHWYYEEDDESIKELGEQFESIFDIPFELKKF